MVTVNHNYLRLPGSYLFSTIGKKVRAYKELNPDKEVISLGIGDVNPAAGSGDYRGASQCGGGGGPCGDFPRLRSGSWPMNF